MNKHRSGIITWVAFPVSLIYGIVVFIRNMLFDLNILKSQEFKIPIISVGNIAVGGTGKTPHVEYLISLLVKEFSLASISRGYKRKSKGFVLADTTSTVADIGDEARQIKQKFQKVNVVVDANRVKAIHKLMDEIPSLEVILLDDAFQHRYVTPGLSILLIDFNHPFNEDSLLPLGRLREPASGKRRADIIILTKSPKTIKPIERRVIEKNLEIQPYQTIYFTTLKYGNLKPVFDNNTNVLSTDDLKNYNVLLVAGIADPDLFNKQIQPLAKKTEVLFFPDHTNYSAKDLKHIENVFNSLDGEKNIIITTEKDAMRLQNFNHLDEKLKQAFFYLPIEIEFIENEGDVFNKHILDYVRKNKRSSILYKESN
jgi:tetraacyldisaccharide 4'-kinase